MKKGGVLNEQLLRLISKAGHGDLIVVTDRGFPLPQNHNMDVIDLGISEGIPSFLEIIKLLARELEIEALIHADESLVKCPQNIAAAKKVFPVGIPCFSVSHEMVKQTALSGNHPRYGRIIGFVRTGEFTAYSNIILKCGVVF